MVASTKQLQFNVIFRPEPEGGFTVLVPSLPGCITYGKNLKEAKKMAVDAITLYVETLMEDSEPIPSDIDSLSASLHVTVEASAKSCVYA